MKRLFLGIAAVALLLVTTETASARPWYGGVSAGYGWGGPYVGASYGTRVGNNGFVSVGYSTGFGGYSYPAYGGYSYPAYGYSYAAPAYYTTPVYDTTYTTPVYASTYVAPSYYAAPAYGGYYGGYYGGPSIGVSYYRGGGGWGRGWGRGWGW
jgi:hypothetical protein